MIRMRASSDTALAISTICCWPIRRSSTSMSGRMSASSRSRNSPARRSCALWSMCEDAAGELARGEDVLGDRQIAEQVELLEHDADAARHRVARRGERHLLAVEQDPAVRRLLDAGDDLHQRRLAGAVLADQHVDRAAPDLEVRALHGDRAGIDLRDVLQLEDHVVGGVRHGAGPNSACAGVISGRSEPEPGT